MRRYSASHDGHQGRTHLPRNNVSPPHAGHRSRSPWHSHNSANWSEIMAGQKQNHDANSAGDQHRPNESHCKNLPSQKAPHTKKAKAQER